jgi:hypothetical protein
LLKKMAVSLFATFLMVLILEAGVRFYAAWTGNQPKMFVDATLGWRLRPNVTAPYSKEEQPYVVRTNSRGLRDQEYSYERSASRIRIVVLGDSMVFGAGGVDSAETFTELLEVSDPRLEAINMGIPAYSTDQEYLYLQLEALKYHPDLVILSVFPNDFKQTFNSWDDSIGLPKGYFTLAGSGLQYHAARISWLSAAARWSHLAHLLIGRFRPLARGRRWEAAPELTDEEKERIFMHLLTAMHEVCERAGAKFAVLYIPSRDEQGGASFKVASFKDVIVRTGSKNRFATLDLTVALGKANSIQPAYFKEDIHLNRRGHQIVADALRDLVSKEFPLTYRR